MSAGNDHLSGDLMVPPSACDFSARAIGRFQTKREQAWPGSNSRRALSSGKTVKCQWMRALGTDEQRVKFRRFEIWQEVKRLEKIFRGIEDRSLTVNCCNHKGEYKKQIDEWIRLFRKIKLAPGTNGPLIPVDPEREAEAI